MLDKTESYNLDELFDLYEKLKNDKDKRVVNKLLDNPKLVKRAFRDAWEIDDPRLEYLLLGIARTVVDERVRQLRSVIVDWGLFNRKLDNDGI